MSKRQRETELSPKEQKLLLKRRRRKRKIILLVMEVFVLLIVLGALYVWQALNKIEKAPAGEKLEPSDLSINEEMDDETMEILQGYEDVAI